ncbi:MAG: hypothetical protein PF590_07295 [Candidatus Delongbacteria bacterium]|jgi:hypothetical protein|nr:hypothetical protein [Candidatus Delongbacteria bacterium]
MKFIKSSFAANLTFAFLIFALSCSGPKQIGDSNECYFKNQSLSLDYKVNFRRADTYVDSSMFKFTNQKNEEFQIRVPKQEAYKMYQEIEQFEKISFSAKKHLDSGYIIKKETIKEETN